MSLIFDTGSSWLWVPSSSCYNCSKSMNLFKSERSISYKEVSMFPQHVQYGGGSVWGYQGQDQVCLQKSKINSCITNFNFLSVSLTDQLEGLKGDGILGLAPSNQNTGSELFIDRLKREGIIKDRVFSFMLGGTDEESKAIFGGYDMRFASENKTISWNSLVSTDYWTLGLSRVSFGELSFKLSTSEAIIDTGTSYILMPQQEFNQFKRALEAELSCSIDQGRTNLFYCQCLTKGYSDFPSLQIQIGLNLYSVPSTTYMRKENFKCYFRFMPQNFNGKGFWILGDTFLLNYYAVFDLDNKRVGLVGSVHVDQISYWRDLLLLASLGLIVYGLGSFLYNCWIEKRQNAEQIQVWESELSENPRFSRLGLQPNQENSNNRYQNPQLNL